MLGQRFRCIRIDLYLISVFTQLADLGITYAWIIRDSAGQIEVSLIVLIKHSSADVWHISTSVALTSGIYLEVFDAKDGLPVFEEAHEVLSNLLFGCCRDIAE